MEPVPSIDGQSCNQEGRPIFQVEPTVINFYKHVLIAETIMVIQGRTEKSKERSHLQFPWNTIDTLWLCKICRRCLRGHIINRNR